MGHLKMENIRLNINSGSSSTVYIRDSFDDFYLISEHEKSVIAVIDKNVEKLYGDCFPYKKIVIGPVKEKIKTLKTVDFIIGELLKMEADRDTLLLGIGGGITTDITGFAASIYKRGIRCAYVSTSLLGQVDASFGGKTGVNYEGYKNIIGTFSQPVFSYLNISTLKTLPPREFSSGIVEMLKMFIIADRGSYQTAVTLFSGSKPYDTVIFEKLLTTAVRLKSWIVERDDKEKGERRLLNLGHTFGHAIEKCAADRSMPVLHGEAVSMGIIISAMISSKLRHFSNENLESLIDDFTRLGLPTRSPFSIEELFAAVKADKKREGDSIHMALINNIGSTFLETISIDELAEVSNDLY